MRRLALFVASLMLAFGTFAWVSPATTVTAQNGGYAPDGEEAAFVQLLNDYRSSLGLGLVSLNYELGAAAEYHSYDMGINNYFDHYLFDGTDPGTNIQNFGYSGFPYSENIAAGMGTAQEVMIAWQNSPTHNATMTDPQFTEVGIGRYYAEGSYYGWYWTATYGAGEAAPAAAPIENAPVETAPVDIAPVEVASETEPAPIISPDETMLSGSVETSGSTTTWQEPPTVVTNDGGMVEWQQNAVDADGDRAVSTGSNPVSDGTGETIIYGDINTGGVQGETIVYEPPSLAVTDGAAPAPAPAPAETTYVEPTTTGTTYTEPVAAEPVYTDPTFSETTTTDISMDDGNGRAIG